MRRITAEQREILLWALELGWNTSLEHLKSPVSCTSETINRAAVCSALKVMITESSYIELGVEDETSFFLENDRLVRT